MTSMLLNPMINYYYYYPCLFWSIKNCRSRLSHSTLQLVGSQNPDCFWFPAISFWLLLLNSHLLGLPLLMYWRVPKLTQGDFSPISLLYVHFLGNLSTLTDFKYNLYTYNSQFIFPTKPVLWITNLFNYLFTFFIWLSNKHLKLNMYEKQKTKNSRSLTIPQAYFS